MLWSDCSDRLQFSPAESPFVRRVAAQLHPGNSFFCLPPRSRTKPVSLRLLRRFSGSGRLFRVGIPDGFGEEFAEKVINNVKKSVLGGTISALLEVYSRKCEKKYFKREERPKENEKKL